MHFTSYHILIYVSILDLRDGNSEAKPSAPSEVPLQACGGQLLPVPDPVTGPVIRSCTLYTLNMNTVNCSQCRVALSRPWPSDRTCTVHCTPGPVIRYCTLYPGTGPVIRYSVHCTLYPVAGPAIGNCTPYTKLSYLQYANIKVQNIQSADQNNAAGVMDAGCEGVREVDDPVPKSWLTC